jgi:hypothetical protein
MTPSDLWSSRQTTLTFSPYKTFIYLELVG